MRLAIKLRDYVISPRYWSWLGNRRSLVVLLWLLTFLIGAYSLWHALTWFNTADDTPPERRRGDGNIGHLQIDFGGQWLMARMLVLGHGRELYHRQRQWEVARDAYPVELEPPLVQLEAIVPGPQRQSAKAEEPLHHDADRLMGWFMGSDPEEWKQVGGAVVAPFAGIPCGNPLFAAAVQQRSRETLSPELIETVTKPAIGGPLYPPIQAFYYAPIGLIDRPLVAYHVFQVILMLSVVFAGLGIKYLTQGRIWWSVGTLLVLIYPGTRAGLDLGQNPTVTLVIVIWGWVLASRGYNVAGGMVWGLLAFKPVWGLALFLVPLLTRRWRFCFSMVLTGICLAAATVPFVGIQSWFDWLTVGKEASETYNVNRNWIMLSRDLQGIPRRILHDFTLPEPERDTPLASALAWSLWGFVFLSTVTIHLRWGDRGRVTGIGTCFLFLGAYLTCYRFMYYDALLSLVGVVVLLAEPARLLRTRVFSFALESKRPDVGERRELGQPPVPSRFGAFWTGYLNSFPLTLIALLLIFENALTGMDLQATFGFGYYSHTITNKDGSTATTVPKIVADTSSSYPTETFFMLGLWIWCGVQLIRGVERRNE